MENTEINIIVSRENGIIGATFDNDLAEKVKKDQTFKEEMGGGRPSVWITTIPIITEYPG